MNTAAAASARAMRGERNRAASVLVRNLESSSFAADRTETVIFPKEESISMASLVPASIFVTTNQNIMFLR